MEVSSVLKSMEHDLDSCSIERCGTPLWFEQLHPAIFAQWSIPLSTDPADVIHAVLSQQCPEELVVHWWRRFGFLAQDANDVFMMLDRDVTLERLLPYALEGAIWHVARGVMVSYSPNDHISFETESTVDMAIARQTAKRMWVRLWRRPEVAVKAPCLQKLVLRHPTTISALWAAEPEEAYRAQLSAVSFLEKRHRECFYNMLQDCFPQHASAIQWLDQEETSCEDAWTTIWSLVEGSSNTGTELPPLDDIEMLI